MINTQQYSVEIVVGDKYLPQFTSPRGGHFIIGNPGYSYKLVVNAKKSGLLLINIDGNNLVHSEPFSYDNIKGVPCRPDETINISYWLTPERKPLVFAKAGGSRKKNPMIGTIGIGFIPSRNEDDEIFQAPNSMNPVVETSIVYDTDINLRVWGVTTNRIPPIPYAFPNKKDEPSWVKQ